MFNKGAITEIPNHLEGEFIINPFLVEKKDGGGGGPTSNKLKIVHILPARQDGGFSLSSKHSKQEILHVQTGFEGSILSSSIKSCIQKTCAVSLVREAFRVSLPLFWTRPSTKYFYKINQNSSFSVASLEHTNYNLLGRHVVDRPYNRRSVNGQRHSNLPSSTARVCTEFKEVNVDTYTENRVLRGDSGFIDHDSVSTREESLKSSEVLSGTSSENTSVDLRTTKLTIQAVLPAQMNFQYLQQQQMLALKTQGSYCKKETLRKNCSGG